MFSRLARTTLAVLMSVGTVAGGAGVATAQEPVEAQHGTAYQPRKGFYVESQVGVFTAFGGAFGGSRAYSNAQPFMAVSVGMDIEAVKGLSGFLAVGHGFNSGACLDFDGVGCALYPGQSPAFSPDSFSVIPVELGARYAFAEPVPRLTLNATLVAGYTLLTPQVTANAPGGSAHAGVGFGVDYATRFSGLSVGAELLVRSSFAPLIPSFTAYPRFRFVF